MTGEHVYKWWVSHSETCEPNCLTVLLSVSLELTEFSLRNYHKSSSSISIFSRNKKSKDKKQTFRGGRAHLQMWTREKPNSPAGPDVRIAILAGETLIIIKGELSLK